MILGVIETAEQTGLNIACLRTPCLKGIPKTRRYAIKGVYRKDVLCILVVSILLLETLPGDPFVEHFHAGRR